MKKFFMLMVAIGVFMLFGSAGASSVSGPSMDSMTQGFAAICILLTGFFGLLMVRLDEIDKRREKKRKAMKRRQSAQGTYVYNGGRAA